MATASPCFDLSFTADQRFKELKPLSRSFAAVLVAQIQTYGDGVLTDDQLRAGWSISRKRMDDIVAVMREIGKLERTDGENGNLRCVGAGIVRRIRDEKPSKAEANGAGMHGEQGVARTDSPRSSTSNRTLNSAQNVPFGTPMEVAASRENSNSNSELENSSHICDKNSNSNSDGIQNSQEVSETEGSEPQKPDSRGQQPPALLVTEPPRTHFDPPNWMSPLPARGDVVAALMHFRFTESQANKFLKDRSIADIVAGIDCLERGFWRSSENPHATLRNYLDGKLGLNSAYVKAHVKPLAAAPASGQQEAVMSVDGGLATEPHIARDPLDPQKPEYFAPNSALRQKIKRPDDARDRVRPVASPAAG